MVNGRDDVRYCSVVAFGIIASTEFRQFDSAQPKSDIGIDIFPYVLLSQFVQPVIDYSAGLEDRLFSLFLSVILTDCLQKSGNQMQDSGDILALVNM